jgi:hypothetical protein
MSKFLKALALILLAAVMPFMTAGIGESASEDEANDFLMSVLNASWDFQQSRVGRITLTSEKGVIITDEMFETDEDEAYAAQETGYRFYQSRESVAIMHEDGPESTFVFFTTQDPSINFAGGIKVGGPISAALAPGVIPGKHSEQKYDDGSAHVWEEGFVIFQIYDMGGKIVTVV